MAQLIVRNLDDDVVEALRVQAAKRGRSAEAEHREILRAALLPKPRRSLKHLLSRIPDEGDDADFDIPRTKGRPVKL